MSEIDEVEALKALKTMPMLLAWVFKTEGADGVKALFEGRITGCEYVQGWADQLRAMRLTKLADLLDRIAETTPPKDVIPDKDKGWSFDRPRERAWAEYLAAHPDDERLLAHDRAWRQERAAWLMRSGADSAVSC